MKQPAAVLDIGSSKVVCLIGDCTREGQFELYGAGIYEYRGIKKRAIIDDTSLRMAIHNAVEQPQLEARRRIKSVYVGVLGQMVEVVCKNGTIHITRSDRRIVEDDIDALIENSLDFFKPETYELIHSLPVRFRVGDVRFNNMPVGMEANELVAQVAHTMLLSDFRKTVESALDEIDVTAAMFVHAQLAEGIFVIEPELRERVSVVVDAGYHSTDVDIFRNGAVVSHTSLDVGGMHFASDLTYGLEIAPDAAESIKRRHVFGLDYEGSLLESIRTTSGRGESFEYEYIRYILDARAHETAALIKDVLANCGFKVPRSALVYLLGGGMAMMRGSRELLQDALGMPVHVQTPLMPRLNSPNYTSAFGVLSYRYNSVSDTGERMMSRQGGDFLDKLVHFFTK